MLKQSKNSLFKIECKNQSWFTPHKIALIIMWLATTCVIVIMLVQGVRNTDNYQLIRHAMHAVYVAVLLWFLTRSGSSCQNLPHFPTFIFPAWRYGKFIPVFFIATMLLLTAVSDDAMSILLLLLMVSTICILIVWRNEIRLRMVLSGLIAAALAFLGGLPMWNEGFVSDQVFLGFLIFVPLMFVTGALLYERTKLGGIRTLTGNLKEGLKSFAWGCLLFVPLGLLNAAEGSTGIAVSWVDKWWMTVSLPLFSGIAEEVWYRLMLLGLCYYLMRPAFKKHPSIAVIFTVLFSATTFSLGHGRTMERFLTTGLLYGLPMSVVFVRRDWEHAAGAHYMINMIPWVMAFLEH